ncbi:hypothetical protein ACQ86G_13645 [Roseateles chitinivorans]|uniref:hypothetical protein n=1 Tax=Roseateles chitinivorans TaxID=2917965 RepID=UPI003D673185
MGALRFLFSGTLHFVAVGPLVAAMGFIAYTGFNLADNAFPLFSVTLFSYLIGIPYALLYGSLCCLVLLAATAAWPGLAHDKRPLTRCAVAIAIGFGVTCLLQGLQHVPALLRGALTADEAWQRTDLALVFAIYLNPTLVAAGFVGWKLVPRLRQPRP